MKHETKQRNISTLMTLLVFFLFAVTLLMVILSSARLYKNTVDSSRQCFDRRTVFLYLTTRVRQADSADQIALGIFGDGDALIFLEEFDGEVYHTLVYSHDGWLRELFCAESARLSPADGEKILPLQSLALDHIEGGIRLQVTLPDGTALSFFLHLQTNTEVLP